MFYDDIVYRQVRPFIKSPFDNLHKKLPKTEKKEQTVIRFDDWLKFLDNLEEHYKPIAELMILTGMIPSEMAGIREISVFPLTKLIMDVPRICPLTSLTLQV